MLLLNIEQISNVDSELVSSIGFEVVECHGDLVRRFPPHFLQSDWSELQNENDNVVSYFSQFIGTMKSQCSEDEPPTHAVRFTINSSATKNA